MAGRRPRRALWFSIALATCLATCAPAPPASTPSSRAPAAAPATPGGPGSAAAQPAAAQSVAVVANPTPLPRRPVKIAHPSLALAQMPFLYGQDQGIFARYGLDTEGVSMTTAPAIAALVNGDIQYIYSGTTLLISAAKGLPIRTLLSSSRGPTLHFFARPEITGFAELRGKAVSVLSVGGLSREVTELVIEKHGVDPKDVQYIAAGSTPGQMEHLRQGIAVAATIAPPWPVAARREGYRQLANLGEEVPYPSGLFGSTTMRIADDPAEVKAMIRAILETNRLIRDESATAVDWIARRFEVDQEVAAESHELIVLIQNADGEVQREAVANYFRVQDEQTDLQTTRYARLWPLDGNKRIG